MKRVLVYMLVLICMSAPLLYAQHEFGASLHYWTVLDDLDAADFDDSGISYYFNYRYRFYGPLRVELGLERLPDRFGEGVYAPQGFLILGNQIYVGAGLGAAYTDGSFSDEPFYTFKAGISLPLPFWLRFDVSAQYRFNDFADLRDEERSIGTDTIFLGGGLRLTL